MMYLINLIYEINIWYIINIINKIYVATAPYVINILEINTDIKWPV